jgi:hypothetical protein
MLRAREGDVEHGIPITPKMDRVSVRRIDLHLKSQEVDGRKIFAGRRLASITTSDIRKFIAVRLEAKAPPGGSTGRSFP